MRESEPAMPGNRQNFSKAMQAADRYRWDNKWEKAIEEYQRALKEFPDDATARMGLGFSYMQMRQWQPALNEYEYVMKQDVSNVIALDKAAELYGKLNRQEEAYNAYLRLMDLYAQAGQTARADAARQKADMFKPVPSPLPAWLEALRADAPPQSPQQPSALDFIDESALPPWLRDNPPAPPQPFIDESALPSWMRNNPPDNALPQWMEPEKDDLLRQAIDRAVASISTHRTLPENIRSQVLQFMKDVQKYAYYGLLTSATEECLRIIDVAPQYLEIHPVLCEIYVKQGKVEQAVTKYAILVDTYVVNGRIDDAIAAYHRILQLQPDNLMYRTRLNKLLASQGKKEDVLREQAPEVTKPPQQPAIVSGGNPDPLAALQALQALQAPANNKQSPGQKITADQVMGVLKRAQTLQSQGRFNEAIDLCEQILANGFDRPDARYFLGWLYQEQRRWHEAISQFQALLNDPDYALSCYYALGQCYRALGDLRKAILHFDEAVDRVNLDALIIDESDQLLQLCREAAEAHQALGEREQALTIYNALLDFLRRRGWNEKVGQVERLLQQMQNAANRVPPATPQPLPPPPQPSVIGELPDWLTGILNDADKMRLVPPTPIKPPEPAPALPPMISVPSAPSSEPLMDDEELQDLLSSTQLPAGTILKERYHIVSRVGKGGMGAVYKTKDANLNNRFVAVKQMLQFGWSVQERQLPQAQQILAEHTKGFRREAELLANLMHPNLPRIYEHFTEGECCYIVMDYIEGINLLKHLERCGGRLPLAEALRIGIDLSAVLSYLHSQQPPIIFRDLKPANVMRTSTGHLYLIDFGIARLFKPEQTKDTAIFLSPGYAAPEQHGSGQTTPQSDIYSLGATLHHLLSGHHPAETPFIFSPLQTDYAELNTLVRTMVEIDKKNRPANTEVIRQALQRILTQVQNSPQPASPPPVGARPGYLRIIEGKDGASVGRVYEISKSALTIGRARESDIFLDDLAVSRLHASISNQGNGTYAAKDEGSANGTKLNWQPMNKYQTYPLQEGDKIQVGQTTLVFTYLNQSRSRLADSFIL